MHKLVLVLVFLHAPRVQAGASSCVFIVIACSTCTSWCWFLCFCMLQVHKLVSRHPAKSGRKLQGCTVCKAVLADRPVPDPAWVTQIKEVSTKYTGQ